MKNEDSNSVKDSRDVEKLYCYKETLNCASNGCRPCCYKLIIKGVSLLPNQRPELCPRAVMNPTQLRKAGIYESSMRILTVGDGNFSFSVALATQLNVKESAGTIVATSHESYASVIETYPDAKDNLNMIKKLEVKVLHDVDATDTQHLEKLGTFDRIIWNFPCIRKLDGADGQNQEMEENKLLVRKFMRHAPSILSPGGELHITHKTKAPYSHWGILSIAEEESLIHIGSIVFDRCMFTGYKNKKALSRRSFPIWDSQTYIFGKATNQSMQNTILKYSSSKICSLSEWRDLTSSKRESLPNLLAVTTSLLQNIKDSIRIPSNGTSRNSEKPRKKRRTEP